MSRKNFLFVFELNNYIFLYLILFLLHISSHAFLHYVFIRLAIYNNCNTIKQTLIYKNNLNNKIRCCLRTYHYIKNMNLLKISIFDFSAKHLRLIVYNSLFHNPILL